MKKTIRVLTSDDFPLYEAMDTSLEDDYIKVIFNYLTTDNNQLYGLFIDNQLAAVAGFTIVAERYAMLGRLRTARSFRGKSYASEIMAYVRDEAFQVSGVEWVGANTEEHNKPTRHILEKIGLTPYITLHTATTQDLSSLDFGANLWQPVHSLERKKEWLQKAFLNDSKVFPYECYYPFPASEPLFPEEHLRKWSFFENDEKTRFVITKHDSKGTDYLHTVYPWNDISSQEGLWETISHSYRQLTEEMGEETRIWIDLTNDALQTLPADHPFSLLSQWILHGEDKK
ncbi:GNAT family N-acetyltransferase [Salipaludibacillus sp. HK11]|uniref:GNAT family N-acetyltransferase n=1 Tax=Salipaludibacillus sp. HK11 TaxID=3394320 RepID=UPI0039FCE033